MFLRGILLRNYLLDLELAKFMRKSDMTLPFPNSFTDEKKEWMHRLFLLVFYIVTFLHQGIYT
uniref:Uncharacterized protein n=1 Tax=Daphnia magna TaxID=35525 RepID=A0A0P6II50_9CRUS